MTFLRLNRWDWLAFVAALALLLVMSADWYTTRQGQECRRIEQLQPTNPGPQGNAIGSDIRRSARELAHTDRVREATAEMLGRWGEVLDRLGRA